MRTFAEVVLVADLGLAIALVAELAFVFRGYVYVPRTSGRPVAGHPPAEASEPEHYCPACLDCKREMTAERVPTPPGAMMWCRHHLRALSVLYAEQDGNGERSEP